MLEHRLALVVLNMLPGVGPGRKKLLVEMFGSAEAALAATSEELCRLPGIGSHLGEVISHWEKYCDLSGEMDLVRRSGVALVTEEDENYPELLREIHDPPICLYVLGTLEALKKSRKSIAIVGSRHTTAYGMRMADMLASSACYAGWPVISGLARGIDTVAHESSLRAGGVTVAVVGSGMTCLYPQENLGLAQRIVSSGGALVSEFPMQYRPDRRTFPMRNRIISGMSQGTIVVQAGLQSGSLITAAQALEQGRVVFAVPGPADQEQSRGCHALIRDGARITENFDDVLDEFSQFPGLTPRALREQNKANDTKTPASELQLSGLELKLFNLLESGEKLLDDLIDESEEEASSVLACLMTLELRRLVKQLPGKRVVRV